VNECDLAARDECHVRGLATAAPLAVPGGLAHGKSTRGEHGAPKQIVEALEAVGHFGHGVSGNENLREVARSIDSIEPDGVLAGRIQKGQEARSKTTIPLLLIVHTSGARSPAASHSRLHAFSPNGIEHYPEETRPYSPYHRRYPTARTRAITPVQTVVPGGDSDDITM